MKDLWRELQKRSQIKLPTRYYNTYMSNKFIISDWESNLDLFEKITKQKLHETPTPWVTRIWMSTIKRKRTLLLEFLSGLMSHVLQAEVWFAVSLGPSTKKWPLARPTYVDKARNESFIVFIPRVIVYITKSRFHFLEGGGDIQYTRFWILDWARTLALEMWKRNTWSFIIEGSNQGTL
jgi:hypothetical protein